jgi:hypothetical protein
MLGVQAASSAVSWSDWWRDFGVIFHVSVPVSNLRPGIHNGPKKVHLFIYINQTPGSRRPLPFCRLPAIFLQGRSGVTVRLVHTSP